MKALILVTSLAVLAAGCGPPRVNPQDLQLLAVGDQAIAGGYRLHRLSPDRVTDCTLHVWTNRTFAISNLPLAGPRVTTNLSGTWSLSLYRILGAPRYRVHFTGGTQIAKVFFSNADRPDGTDPVSLTLWWRLPGRTDPVTYQFKKVAGTP